MALTVDSDVLAFFTAYNGGQNLVGRDSSGREYWIYAQSDGKIYMKSQNLSIPGNSPSLSLKLQLTGVGGVLDPGALTAFSPSMRVVGDEIFLIYTSELFSGDLRFARCTNINAYDQLTSWKKADGVTQGPETLGTVLGDIPGFGLAVRNISSTIRIAVSVSVRQTGTQEVFTHYWNGSVWSMSSNLTAGVLTLTPFTHIDSSGFIHVSFLETPSAPNSVVYYRKSSSANSVAAFSASLQILSDLNSSRAFFAFLMNQFDEMLIVGWSSVTGYKYNFFNGSWTQGISGVIFDSDSAGANNYGGGWENTNGDLRWSYERAVDDDLFELVLVRSPVSDSVSLLDPPGTGTWESTGALNGPGTTSDLRPFLYIDGVILLMNNVALNTPSVGGDPFT